MPLVAKLPWSWYGLVPRMDFYQVTRVLWKPILVNSENVLFASLPHFVFNDIMLEAHSWSIAMISPLN